MNEKHFYQSSPSECRDRSRKCIDVNDRKCKLVKSCSAPNLVVDSH